jgi:hypothetical protein
MVMRKMVSLGDLQLNVGAGIFDIPKVLCLAR